MKKKLVKEISKIGGKIVKELAVAIAKSALIVAIKEWVVVPLMRRLKKIYDRNPEFERQFGL